MKKTIKQLAAVAVVPVVGITMGLNSAIAGAQIQSGVNAINNGQAATDLKINEIVQAVVNWLLFAVGVVSVIMLIWGGIKYATSAGDSNKVTSAKNTIMYAIIGLAVAVLAFAIVQFVMSTLANGTVNGPQ